MVDQTSWALAKSTVTPWWMGSGYAAFSWVFM